MATKPGPLVSLPCTPFPAHTICNSRPDLSYVMSAPLTSASALCLRPGPFLQVVMPLDKKKADPSNSTLVEVGPRCALRPIKIFEGSFGGRVLYDNPEYVSPNLVRRLLKQQKAGKYVAKVTQKAKRRAREEENVLPVNEVDEVFQLSE